MIASAKSFYVSLYEEHLAECSVLLEQIAAYRHDPALAWTDVGDWEARLARHIDALALSDAPVDDVCRRRLADGDSGEREAALRVLSRRRQKEAVYAALRDADTADSSVVAAYAAALAAELPAEWRDELATVAARHARLAPLLAPALGRARAPAAASLLAALDAQTDAAEPLVRALGRVGTLADAPAVAALARSDEPRIAAAAAIAAARLGYEPLVQELLLAAPTRPWLAIPLALAGRRSAVRVLEDVTRAGAATGDVLLALGLLGDLGAVRAVFDCLAHPELAPAAAAALRLITGAELYADVFVPDEIDPDELFDEERARYEATGELPKRANGEPFGALTTQPVIDPAVWKEWLSQNKTRFDRERRYRYGELYGPRALAKSLAAPRTPNAVRALIGDELKIRYAVDFPLDVEMPVLEQQRLLARLEQWVLANEASFTPGGWYFHGRAVDAS